jgi:hypothetical protein
MSIGAMIRNVRGDLVLVDDPDIHDKFANAIMKIVLMMLWDVKVAVMMM